MNLCAYVTICGKTPYKNLRQSAARVLLVEGGLLSRTSPYQCGQSLDAEWRAIPHLCSVP